VFQRQLAAGHADIATQAALRRQQIVEAGIPAVCVEVVTDGELIPVGIVQKVQVVFAELGAALRGGAELRDALRCPRTRERQPRDPAPRKIPSRPMGETRFPTVQYGGERIQGGAGAGFLLQLHPQRRADAGIPRRGEVWKVGAGPRCEITDFVGKVGALSL
jgi:hypothetical protein